MSLLIAEVENVVGPLLQSENVELVDLTYQKTPVGWTLCFYLDKPGGITLEDCEKWSCRLEDVLDQTDLIPHAYSLEVSSPGLNRPLKKQSDFDRFKGERVHVKLFAALNGQKNFHGILLGADESVLYLKQDDRGEIKIPFQQVAKTRLNPRLDF